MVQERPVRVAAITRRPGMSHDDLVAAIVDGVARAGAARAILDLAGGRGSVPRRPGDPGRAQGADAVVAVDAGVALADVVGALAPAGTLVGAYAVDAVRHWDRLGDDPPALVLHAFVTARRGSTAEQFRRRYLDHAAVAREHHPGIAAYEQWFVTDRREGSRAADALARLAFASVDDYQHRFYRDAESPDAVAADVARVLERDATWSVVTTERLVVERT